ncbi:MAG: hypothetical protein ABIK18_00940 [candidate division WOR-3 bacterium]
MAESKKFPPKPKEEIVKVDFAELERIRRPYRHPVRILVVLIFLAILIWLGLKFCQTYRLPERKPTPTDNLWVPGIDYQVKPEGD